jgi:putative MATE family efflux protein
MSQLNLQDLNLLPVKTLFWRYVIPSIAGMLVIGLYTVVDGIFVGRYVGAHALAAINLVYPIILLQIGLGAMISMGAATRISILQGAGQLKQARQALANTLLIIAAMGIVLPIIGISQLDSLLALLKADSDPAVLQEARSYLSIMLWGGLVTIGQMAVIYLVRNDGRPQFITSLVTIGGLSNIGLNYFFVVILGWGLAGSAGATLLVETLITLAGLIYFFSPFARLRLALEDLRPHWQSMPSMLGLGVSSLLMEANLAFLLFAHNYQLLAYGQGSDIAAYAVAGYTEAVFILLIHGLALGMQPLLSHATGANQAKRLAQTLSYGLKVSLGISLALLSLVQFFPQTIATLYAGADQALIQSAAHALQIHLFALPFDGAIIVGVIALQAMALTRLSMFGTLGKTLLLIPALWLMPQWWGVNGVYIALPLVNMLIGIVIAGVLWRELGRLKGVQDQSTVQPA